MMNPYNIVTCEEGFALIEKETGKVLAIKKHLRILLKIRNTLVRKIAEGPQAEKRLKRRLSFYNGL